MTSRAAAYQTALDDGIPVHGYVNVSRDACRLAVLVVASHNPVDGSIPLNLGMDISRNVPLAGAAPVIGIAAADNQIVIAPQHIRPDAGGDFRSRGIGRSIVVAAGQGHSCQVSRSGDGIHGTEPLLHGRSPDAVQGQRLLVYQRTCCGRGSLFQPPGRVPDGLMGAGSRKRDDCFSVHGADCVQGLVNIRQSKAVPQINAQVIGGVHQGFRTEQVLKFLKTGEINEAGSQRHVLQHAADIVHGSIIQTASIHRHIARDRPGTVGEDAHRFPYREGVLEIHGARRGGDGAVSRQLRHGHGSGARIQSASGKRGVNGTGPGEDGAGIDGIGSRKRHVFGKMHPARLGDEIACPGDGIVNDIRHIPRSAVIGQVLGVGRSSNGGSPKGAGSTDAQRSKAARNGNRPPNFIGGVEQVVIGIFIRAAADGKTACRRENTGKLHILAPAGCQVDAAAENRCSGKIKTAVIDGSGIIGGVPRHGRTVLDIQRGAVTHDQFLGPGDISGEQGKSASADFQGSVRRCRGRERRILVGIAQGEGASPRIVHRYGAAETAAVRGRIPRNGQRGSLPGNQSRGIVVLQLADGSVHAGFQDGSARRITVTAQFDRGVLGGLRVVEVQDVVLRSPRRVGIKGNDSVESACPVQCQGGKAGAPAGHAVYRQDGFRSRPVQIGDGGRTGSGKIQGSRSRNSTDIIGGRASRRHIHLGSVKGDIRRIGL